MDPTRLELPKAENAFLALARSGKNSFWRYLLTNLMVIGAAIVAQILVALPVFILTGTLDLNQLPSLATLILSMAPFPAAALVLGLGVWLLHKRSPRSLLTARPHFDWRRLLASAALWLVLSALGDLILGMFVTRGNYQWTFKPADWLPYAALALVLIPIQSSTEELIFRGYLMPALGLLTRRAWIPLLISSLVFTSLHIFNPEMSAYGAPLILAQIALVGLLLGWVTLRGEGLEAALGLHAANNLYGALLVTYPNAAFQAPALISMKTLNPALSLVALVITAMTYLILLRLSSPDR